MFEVLQTVPGVTEPRLGYVTADGGTLPFLEYRAAEKSSWVEPTRFDARKTDDGDYWFLAYLPGIGEIDSHITETIMEKWKAQCDVDANAIIV